MGELGIVAFILQPFDIVTFTTILFSLIAANIIAMGSSWQLHSYRRRNYKDLLHRKILQDDLEQHSKNLEGIVAERTEKLKDAERLAAIGATAGMVGHDIRNPLTSITGAIYVSKKKIKEIPDGQTKDSLIKSIDLIEDQTLYINKIVADLQDFARPLNPYLEETNIEQLIKSVTATLDVPDNILVEHKIDKNCQTLLIDQTFLKRILNNLSNNAIQAMPDGGKLMVEAYRLEKNMLITVQDTGVGIPEEARANIFTPMFTTKSKGQGFGLAVTKRMTEALGGSVSFESEQGVGTKFTVNLPTRN